MSPPRPDSLTPGERDTIDPEILALLDFEPVPRNLNQPKAWTPELQRRFIAALAVHGSKSQACEEVGKNRTGIDALYNHPEGASFRAAWHNAKELYERRKAERRPAGPLPRDKPPSIDRRRKSARPDPLPRPEEGEAPGEEGEVLNEYGEWEDEDSYARRAEEARESIGMKLVRCRRAFLAEISGNAGKRAAFEILTELPVDWELAKKMEPQPFEPWAGTNQRRPDMVLTAESGWSFGDIGYGPDRKAAARAAVDEFRASEGLPAVDWDGEEELGE